MLTQKQNIEVVKRGTIDDALACLLEEEEIALMAELKKERREPLAPLSLPYQELRQRVLHRLQEQDSDRRIVAARLCLEDLSVDLQMQHVSEFLEEVLPATYVPPVEAMPDWSWCFEETLCTSHGDVYPPSDDTFLLLETILRSGEHFKAWRSSSEEVDRAAQAAAAGSSCGDTTTSKTSITVLEVGCGSGLISASILRALRATRRYSDVFTFATDINPAAVAFTRELLETRVVPQVQGTVVKREGDYGDATASRPVEKTTSATLGLSATAKHCMLQLSTTDEKDTVSKNRGDLQDAGDMVAKARAAAMSSEATKLSQVAEQTDSAGEASSPREGENGERVAVEQEVEPQHQHQQRKVVEEELDHTLGEVDLQQRAKCRQPETAVDIHVHVQEDNFFDTMLTDKRVQPQSVDLLVFNPPYVVTDEGVIHGETDGPIDRAWAGGARGREVIDEMLPRVKSVLRPGSGRFYLCGIAENDPCDIIEFASDHGLKGKLLAQEQQGIEELYVLEFRVAEC
ncbi:unnamed protein product [Amoebophrya sp. A120]|nr:unnamed protein product [Amoebophrya sp. A120]|eukprot:GSA120T00002059001.1